MTVSAPTAHEPSEHAPSVSPFTPQRRVVEETESICPNRLTSTIPTAFCVPECYHCQGSGFYVVQRKVQVGTPFNEQAAHAYVQELHAHLRKAARTVAHAAELLDKAGATKHAHATREAAKAIAVLVEGQD